MNGPIADAAVPQGSAAAGSTLLGRPVQQRRTAPAPSSLVVGDVLSGKYELVGLLGAGGMGTVWQARSFALDIDVAIKVLHREPDDQVAVERLRREAQATARLEHPAIVRVFDFGQTVLGEPFLVMELVRGESLASWLAARGRVPAEQAVQMLLPIAAGLAAAHAQGVIHRDVKPENILVSPGADGGAVLKIVDFGIAKLAARTGPVLTEEGAVIGSLPYMPPEQAQGCYVDEQADIWSLCVVLYELITGRRPFQGATLAAMLIDLHTRLPTPTTELAAGDAELWSILSHGLKKSRAARWHTMRALGEALATWAIARGVTTDAANASLEHHWLGRSSGDFSPSLRHGGGRASDPALALAQTFRAIELTPIPTMALALTTLAPVGPAPTPAAPRRPVARLTARTRLLGTVAVIMLGLAGLGARGWTATASAQGPGPSELAPAPVSAPQLATEPTAAIAVAPSLAATPAAPAATAPSARARRPAGPRKLAASTMPLPRAPGF